ncbi:MAG: hypothetical protein IPM54_19055 [Polyangiaceae bacterium]|nr:hypothetical protein [Polyangiaceae bacterium]
MPITSTLTALDAQPTGFAGSLGLASTNENVTATFRVPGFAGSTLSAVMPNVMGTRLLT